MIPLKLTVRNFMCYRDDVPPLLFDGMHIACLSGDNGAGKSALLDAITWALWGEARAKSDDDLIALGCDEMEVDFEWQLDDAVHRVVRRRTKGKRGQSIVEFQVRNGEGAWRRVSGDSVRDTNEQIASALRMSYSTFINSAFLLQGHADAFTSSKPQERKQVLADIIGLAEYEALEAQAKVRRNEYESTLRNLESHIAEYEREANLRPIRLEDLARAEGRVTTAQADVEAADHEVTRLRDQAQQMAQFAQRRTLLAEDRVRRANEQSELEQTLAEQHEQVRRYQEVVAQGPRITADYEAYQRILTELELMAERQRQAYELKEVWQSHRASVHAAQTELAAQLSYAETKLRGLADQAGTLAEREAIARTLRAEAAGYEDLQAEIERLRSSEEQLVEQQRQADRLLLEQSKLERVVEQARSEIESVLGALEQTVERCAPQVARLPQLELELGELNDRLGLLASQMKQAMEVRAAASARERSEARAREQITLITKQGKEIGEKLKLVQAGNGTCPVCRSDLGEAGQQSVEEMYSGEQARLRSELRQARAEAERLAGEIATLHEQAEQLESAAQSRPTLERRYATLLAQREQATSAQAELATAQAQAGTFGEQLERRNYARDAQKQLATVHKDLTALGEAGTRQSRLTQVRRSIKEAQGRLKSAADIARRLAEAETQVRLCKEADERLPLVLAEADELRARLATEDFAHEARAARDEIRRQIDALGYTTAAHDAVKEEAQRLRPVEQQMRALERALQELEPKQQQLANNQELRDLRAAHIAGLDRELGALDQQLSGHQRIRLALHDAEQTLRSKRSTLDFAQRELGTAEADLRHCDEMIAQLEKFRVEAAVAAEQRSLYSDLVDAFGKKGIQAMLIENALPEIEREANQLLGRMTEQQMHVSLETQRDTKKGDPLETLDIRIADGLGTRDYSLYSGGEAFRVNFALRIALSKLLAHRAGASLKTLVIDEGFGTQDGKGRERVVEAINAVSDDFERVLVITHIQELKDLFDTQIEISKGPQGSVWRIN